MATQLIVIATQLIVLAGKEISSTCTRLIDPLYRAAFGEVYRKVHLAGELFSLERIVLFDDGQALVEFFADDARGEKPRRYGKASFIFGTAAKAKAYMTEHPWLPRRLGL